MNKIIVLMSLLRHGTEVADVEKWKKKQVGTNTLGLFILALVAVAKEYGLEIPIDEGTALIIAGGIIAIINVLLTIVTSKRAGILPAKEQHSGERNSDVPQGLHREDKPLQDKPEDNNKKDIYFG